jgi:hypothetical protein
VYGKSNTDTLSVTEPVPESPSATTLGTVTWRIYIYIAGTSYGGGYMGDIYSGGPSAIAAPNTATKSGLTYGGFGAGGGSMLMDNYVNCAGGGGGYSGGGPGSDNLAYDSTGGGGGNFISGTNAIDVGLNAGAGYVVIVAL